MANFSLSNTVSKRITKKLFFVVSVVMLLAAGCGKPAANPPAAQNQNGQSQATQQSTQPAPAPELATITVPLPTTLYTSAADNFTVNFPSAPKITKSSVPSASGAIAVTDYRQVFTSGSEHAYYNVGVYHFPAGYKFTNDYLNTAFKIYFEVASLSFPEATIISQQPTQFLGSQALTGSITIPVKLGDSAATTNTGVSLLVIRNAQNIYILSAYGMSQNNYNAFINSFKFSK